MEVDLWLDGDATQEPNHVRAVARGGEGRKCLLDATRFALDDLWDRLGPSYRYEVVGECFEEDAVTGDGMVTIRAQFRWVGEGV